MSSEQNKNPDGGDQPKPPHEHGFTQEIQHSQVTARVPEKVARGAFSNGALILQGQHEFVLDFVLNMVQPGQIAARVVLPPTLMPSFLTALRENLQNYQNRFGPPPSLPAQPQPPTPPSIEEIYSNLKLPDELMSGVYANAVMIVHTPAEFCFDFITGFYPRSAVSCRVFLSAAQVPGFFNNLQRSFQQFQQKHGGGQPPPPQLPKS
jgi:hypothetical protein